MRWDRGHRSRDVIDRRGQRGGARSAAGVGILFWLMSRFGVPGVVLGGLVIGAMYFMSSGGEPTDEALGPQQRATASRADEMSAFVGFVLDDAQNTWRRIFGENGATYRPAKLVLFAGQTQSGCGYGTAEVGPFYCPRDERVYIDLGFYDELARRLGAPGDFAQAYVIAHEIGHHVQHQLGVEDEAQRLARGGVDENAISVRRELQADCYAGVWAHFTNQRDILERGDIEEGLGAAAAIGDDALQRQATGQVRPETFTHGSSQQRVTWFQNGFRTGSVEACDTLNGAVP